MTDDLAKFIDDLVERTARRTVELLAEAREGQRVEQATERMAFGEAPESVMVNFPAGTVRTYCSACGKTHNGEVWCCTGWPAGVEVE
jgi:hypothetical protein